MTEHAAHTDGPLIAELAKASLTPDTIADADGNQRATYLRDTTGQVRETIDLEKLEPAPYRKRGTARFSETESLLEYVRRQTEGPAFYAHPPEFSVAAVFNDHELDQPGWRDHMAALRLKPTPEWAAWTGLNRKYSTATQFAEFIEEWRHTVAEPPTADLLDLIRSFRATKKVTFRDEIIDKSGDRALEYVTDTEAQGTGTLAVPDSLTLVMAPFEGAAEVSIVARFRYTIDEGSARFGVVLDQPDKVARDAFDVEILKIETETDQTVMVGYPAA